MSTDIFTYIFTPIFADKVTNVLYEFTNPYLIVGICALGFIFYSRSLFFHAICITAVDVILNVALKGSFEVPLPPQFNATGYIFPSGHTQFITAFYGWLILSFPFWSIRILLAILIGGIILAIIHLGVHTWFDVLGGLAFGILLIIFYQYFSGKYNKNFFWGLLAITSFLMLYNGFIYPIIPSYAWDAYKVLNVLIIVRQGLIYMFPYLQHFFLSNSNEVKSQTNKLEL